MTKLYVKAGTHCHHDYHSGEQFGEWSQHSDPYVDGVYLDVGRNKYSYETFTVDFDVKYGDEVYVLAMSYSSGDSFGSSSGNHEVLWVFKDVKKARAAEVSVRNNSGADSIKITTDTGKVIQLSNPASGYFESLESLNLHVCSVRK